jgi:hypothetical protein
VGKQLFARGVDGSILTIRQGTPVSGDMQGMHRHFFKVISSMQQLEGDHVAGQFVLWMIN